MMTSAEIRQQFLDFFSIQRTQYCAFRPDCGKERPYAAVHQCGHEPVQGLFLGNKQAPWKRVADTQKCLR